MVVFSIDVNTIPSIFFPAFVTAGVEGSFGELVRFVAVHLAMVLPASAFAFAAVLALLGAVSAVLPREALRACSPWVRALFLIAFLMLLVSGLRRPRRIARVRCSTIRTRPRDSCRRCGSWVCIRACSNTAHRRWPAWLRACCPGRPRCSPWRCSPTD